MSRFDPHKRRPYVAYTPPSVQPRLSFSQNLAHLVARDHRDQVDSDSYDLGGFVRKASFEELQIYVAGIIKELSDDPSDGTSGLITKEAELRTGWGLTQGRHHFRQLFFQKCEACFKLLDGIAVRLTDLHTSLADLTDFLETPRIKYHPSRAYLFPAARNAFDTLSVEREGLRPPDLEQGELSFLAMRIFRDPFDCFLEPSPDFSRHTKILRILLKDASIDPRLPKALLVEAYHYMQVAKYKPDGRSLLHTIVKIHDVEERAGQSRPREVRALRGAREETVDKFKYQVELFRFLIEAYGIAASCCDVPTRQEAVQNIEHFMQNRTGGHVKRAVSSALFEVTRQLSIGERLSACSVAIRNGVRAILEERLLEEAEKLKVPEQAETPEEYEEFVSDLKVLLWSKVVSVQKAAIKKLDTFLRNLQAIPAISMLEDLGLVSTAERSPFSPWIKDTDFQYPLSLISDVREIVKRVFLKGDIEPVKKEALLLTIFDIDLRLVREEERRLHKLDRLPQALQFIAAEVRKMGSADLNADLAERARKRMNPLVKESEDPATVILVAQLMARASTSVLPLHLESYLTSIAGARLDLSRVVAGLPTSDSQAVHAHFESRGAYAERPACRLFERLRTPADTVDGDLDTQVKALGDAELIEFSKLALIVNRGISRRDHLKLLTKLQPGLDLVAKEQASRGEGTILLTEEASREVVVRALNVLDRCDGNIPEPLATTVVTVVGGLARSFHDRDVNTAIAVVSKTLEVVPSRALAVLAQLLPRTAVKSRSLVLARVNLLRGVDTEKAAFYQALNPQPSRGP